MNDEIFGFTPYRGVSHLTLMFGVVVLLGTRGFMLLTYLLHAVECILAGDRLDVDGWGSLPCTHAFSRLHRVWGPRILVFKRCFYPGPFLRGIKR